MISKKRKPTYGFAANAAAVRALMSSKVSGKKLGEYVEFIFNTLKISGPDSYEQMLELMQKNEASAEYLVEKISEQEDSEDIFQFVNAFIDTRADIKKDVQNTGSLDSEFIGLFGPDPLHLIDCEVKTQFTEDNQQIQYIEIPDKAFDVLKEDFEIAEHLGVLSEIADSEDYASNLMLICESKETGLLAYKYISGLIGCGDAYEEDETGFEGKLPIIQAVEIDRYYINRGSNIVPIFSGPMGFQVVQNTNPPEPWWKKYNDIPIIVMMEKNDFLSEQFADKLKQFGETHSNINILYEKGREHEPEAQLGSMELGLGGDVDKIADDISFKLEYHAYMLEDPALDSEYNKSVMRVLAKRLGYSIDEAVDPGDLLNRLKKFRGDSWEGNSTITQMIKKAISLKKKDFGVLKQEDFAFLGKSRMPVKNMQGKKQQEVQESAMDRMNRCIFGLEGVKKTISEAVAVIKLNKEREKAGLKVSGINNVFAFSGPPGVGKTEMAQYFTDIMFENNLLFGKNFVNINAAQLKAKYVGHTAHLISSIFSSNDAIFLDEIYSLTAENRGEMDTFSQEALAQLCVDLEKHGREKLIILAGYGGDVSEKNNKMRQFLNANPGIASRVTFTIDFPTYSGLEMLEILQKMADNTEYELELGWKPIALEYFKERRKSESYGNAREARRLLQHATTVQALRLSNSKPDIGALKLITCEDLSSAAARILDAEKKLEGPQKAKIGF